MNSLDEMQMSLQCDEQFVSNGDNFNSNSEDETILRKKKPIFCRHKKWTKEEDNKLRQLVNKFGDKNWRILANSMENRNPRQCRERWQYYLNPFLKISHWTKEEDELIIKKREELGPKWMIIKNFFINRTDAMIKNRYRNLMKIRKKNEENKYNENMNESNKDNPDQLKNIYEQKLVDYFSNENDDDDFIGINFYNIYYLPNFLNVWNYI